MTHDHTHDHSHGGGCCGGTGNGTDQKACKSKCCKSTIAVGLSLAVAAAALIFAFTTHSAATKGEILIKKPRPDVSTLIAGEDTVVAKVDGDSIHKSDVAQTIKELGANVPPAAIDQILPAFTEQYVNLQLINKAAVKADVLNDPEVQLQMANSQEQILRAGYLRKLFDGQITEDSLKEAYKAKYESGELPTEVHARHILVDSEAKAKALIAQLQGGANFEKLASENSKDPSAARGGDLGYFTQAEMVPEFGAAAFAMNKGSISDAPVKTQFGWHVIQVLDKRTRAKPSFEEAKGPLEQESRQKLLDAKLKELREKADVEILTAPAANAATVPAESAPVEAAPASEPAPAKEEAKPAEAPAAETAPAAPEATAPEAGATEEAPAATTPASAPAAE